MKMLTEARAPGVDERPGGRRAGGPQRRRAGHPDGGRRGIDRLGEAGGGRGVVADHIGPGVPGPEGTDRPRRAALDIGRLAEVQWLGRRRLAHVRSVAVVGHPGAAGRELAGQRRRRGAAAGVAQQQLAAGLAVWIITTPVTALNPVGVITTLAASGGSWSNARSHRELAQSYAMVSRELGILEEKARHISTEDQLASWVEEVEHSISREHTMWVRRRAAS